MVLTFGIRKESSWIGFKYSKNKNIAKIKLGEVTSSGGTNYPYYWDSASKKVYVGSEYAGIATDQEDAWRKANYYASTSKVMK